MDIEKRIELITRPPVEEVINNEDLRKLLETKKIIKAYDGFEPSGILHVGSALLRAIKVDDLLKAGVKFTLLFADWHAYLNNKMGGDLDLLKKVAEYFVEGWKACGIDTEKVDIVWASDMVKDPEYWKGVIDVAKMVTLNRTLRASPIMGRKESEMLYTAQLFYPMMQAWDPFYLDVDILQLGMDQRHATILTREIAPKIDKSIKVCVHHHLIASLLGAQIGRMGGETAVSENRMQSEIDNKMSKSKPDTCVYIHDDRKEIERKIKNAYCPEKITEGNPILELWKYIIFRKFDSRIIKRPDKFGGNLEVQNYEELEKIFREGKLHPMDLKNETVEAMDEILGPIRKHFEKGKAKELYEIVKKATITR